MENTPAIIPAFPSSQNDIVGRANKTIGQRYFCGSLSAKQIKEAGKKLNLKGVKLSRYVNDALRNESANRAVVVAATVAELHNRGFIADTVDVKNKAAVIKFVKPAARKASESEKAAEKLAKENEELKAKIAALEAAKN